MKPNKDRDIPGVFGTPRRSRRGAWLIASKGARMFAKRAIWEPVGALGEGFRV